MTSQSSVLGKNSKAYRDDIKWLRYIHRKETSDPFCIQFNGVFNIVKPVAKGEDTKLWRQNQSKC